MIQKTGKSMAKAYGAKERERGLESFKIPTGKINIKKWAISPPTIRSRL